MVQLFSMIREVEASLLADAPLFAGLDAAAIARVAASGQLVAKPAGAAFFDQGDPADAFFLLADGQVRIVQVTPEGHLVTLRYIGPGQVFGAVPLFAGGPYPAGAIAVLGSRAARWTHTAARRLAEVYPPLLANALAIVGRRLQEMQDRYREMATERVERRVARAVLHLAGRRSDGAAGVEIDFPISRQDIAELTGTTLSTVSRILSAWEQKGMLEGGRMHIRVTRPDRLRAIADAIEAAADRQK